MLHIFIDNMSKSSQEKIDEDTRLIIEEIQKNANKSINEIANKLNFSRQKVWRIIKNLEKDKTIWGYTTVINEEKMGFQQYLILIKRTTKPIDKELAELIISRKLEELVPNINIQIKHSFYTHGSFDWIICIKAGDIKEAKLFCEIFNKLYQGYIKYYDLVQILFPIRVDGILNPEADKLHEFV